MKFEEILSSLQEGEVVRRKTFKDSLVIFMQIPAEVSFEKVPNMVSVPEKMKQLIISWGNDIIYHDQFVIYDFSDSTCTYYTFRGEDLNADDWEVVTISNYDPYADCK